MKLKALKWAVLAVLLVLSGLQVYQWFGPGRGRPSLARRQEPFIAPLAEDFVNADTVVVPVDLVILEPTSRVLGAFKEKTGEEPAGTLVSLHDIGKLPYGGYLSLTLEPIDAINPDGPKKVVPKIFPGKPKFFELNLQREVSLSYGEAFGSHGVLGGFVHAEFTQGLFRAGRANWFARAGTFVGSGWHFEYVEAGFSVSWD